MADLKAWAPTTRQEHAAKLQQWLEKIGLERATARRAAQGITGGGSSGLPMGTGLADFTPVGLMYGGEEAGRMVAEGQDALARGDTAGGLMNTALGAGSAALMAMGPVGKLSSGAASKFGKKAVRESALAKKVGKAAAADADDAGVVSKKAARVKVAPDAFRTMEKEQGAEATLAALRKGAHLKPDGKGGYIGAPRTVNSPQALGALRRSIDEQFDDSVEALRAADPTRLGTWYDRAKAAQAGTNEPWQLPRSLEQHGVYSAGVSPESELTFALKHGNSRALGEPAMAYRSAPMRALDSAAAEDRPAKMGFKIGEYRDKNDPRIPNTGLFGVNDFRAAQGMHYTRPDGAIWKGGVSPTMHPFMDGETALAVDRANQIGTGGRADWQGPHLQELPWVYGKAQDLYGRGKRGRFAGPPDEGMAAALRDANNTFADYLYKHAGSATHEAIPGANTGHIPSMLTADDAAKTAYTEAGRWDRPGPEGGPNAIDAIYSALGLRQLPSIKGTGGYLNSAGQFETNPLTVARPLLDFPTGGGGGRVAPLTSRAMNAAERFRAVADAQEAGAWNMPNTGASLKGKNAVVFDTRGADSTTGTMPSGELLARVNAAVNPSGYGLVPTNRGSVLMPFDQDMKPAALGKLLKEQKGLLDELPGVRQKGVVSSGYVPGVAAFDANYNLVPTRPFSGEATMGLLQDLAEAPPEVARSISESEAVRAILREKIARDAALPGARRDIQNTRNFLSEADWNRAVEMIRSGVKPAAALAALGYSASTLAAPEQ